MRQIGTLPRKLDPKPFADHLLKLGMKVRIDDQPEGWLVWIYNEDHISQAREELDTYARQPDDPRYREAARTADEIRRKEKQLDREFRKNDRDASRIWNAPTFRDRPLTTILIIACAVIFFLQNLPNGRYRSIPTGGALIQRLVFSRLEVDAEGHIRNRGLQDIRQGEVWRLFTPTLMHGSLLHILFNMLWLARFGTMIEIKRGTVRLAILYLIAAAVSTYGDYVWMERMEVVKILLGMSGVIYAMFGYIWIKSMYEPEQGLAVGPGTVQVLILWLVICMTGVIGSVANAAHFVGLAVGIALGVMRF